MIVKKCIVVFCLFLTSISSYAQLTAASVLLDNHSLSENKIDTNPFTTKESAVGSYRLSSTIGLGGNFPDNVTTDWDIVLGKFISQRLLVGLGFSLGFNSGDTSWNGVEEQYFLPVFAYSRYYLAKNRYRPFIYLRLGHGFPRLKNATEDYKGGLNFQPGIGLQFPSSNKFHFLLKVGRNIQHTKLPVTSFNADFDPIILDHSRWYNRTMLIIGLSRKIFK